MQVLPVRMITVWNGRMMMLPLMLGIQHAKNVTAFAL